MLTLGDLHIGQDAIIRVVGGEGELDKAASYHERKAGAPIAAGAPLTFAREWWRPGRAWTAAIA